MWQYEDLQLLILFFFCQRDTTLSKKDSNVSIHKKLLCQIVEYEHAHVKVSVFQIFVKERNIYMKLFVIFGNDVLKCNSFYSLFVVHFFII